MGFTESGGNSQCNGNGCGTIYKVAADGTFDLLYNFCSLAQCNDGFEPLGMPILDDAGNIFGATLAGGRGKNDSNREGGGTVFKFSDSTLTTLHTFCTNLNCPDGEYPFPGVVIDSSRNLYGTTQIGGPNGTGEVFQLQQP